MNRGQQAYYLEKSDFAPDITSLGIGVPTSTDYYNYATAGNSKSGAANQATSTAAVAKGTVKAYSGIVWLTQDTSSNNYTSLARVCAGTTSPTTNCAQ
jgi:type IV pilus assembly protein PilA